MQKTNKKWSSTTTNLMVGLIITVMLISVFSLNQDSFDDGESFINPETSSFEALKRSSETLKPKQKLKYSDNKNKLDTALNLSYFPDHKKNIDLFSGKPEDKLILLYFGSFAKWSWHNLDRNPLRCSSGNTCQLTTDHTRLSTASAVVVSLIYLPKNTSMWMPPNYQLVDKQKWIAFFHEAPWYLNQKHKIRMENLNQLDGIFDWTASYRSDATFLKSYLGNCWYEKKKPSYMIETIDKNFLLKMKNKSALWVVSHCRTTSKREDYAKEMSAFMNITIKGKCGTGVEDRSDDSFQDLDTYYFYLSFENSLCDEYITEKFFDILKSGTVPVVMGPHKQDYERLAPPNSFIHISDFDGPRELTQYLIYLQNNPDEYMKYLAWKQHYHLQCDPEEGYRQWGCHLCDKLYQQTKVTQVQKIQDFSKFWNKKKCYGHDYTFNNISII